jgi:hypothetical protein
MKRLNVLLTRRWFGVILFVAFSLLWVFLTKVHTHSWQEESRMATVQTLVEQDTFIIDHTEFNRTGDKVFVAGHFYSDKTPILSVAAAGVYYILHDVFSLTLDPSICVPEEDAAVCRVFTPIGTRFTAFYWLTLIFIGGSASLLVVLFWRAMLSAGASGALAVALALALGLASPLAPYSTVFVGHVPAALCFFAGFYLLTRESSQQRYLWAGILIGLAANIDLTLALFVVAFEIWTLVYRRKQAIVFLIGAIVPFVLTSLLTYLAAGRLIPLYLDPNAYNYPGTVLNSTAGGTNGFYSLEFGLNYAYNLLIGQHGVLAFTPLLIFACLGSVFVIRSNTGGLRGLTVAMLGGSLAFTLYLILRTDNFGGAAWGMRWFVPLIPVWWYYAREAYVVMRQSRFSAIGVLLFWGAVLLSFLTVIPGLRDAWRDVPPIVRL